jgi:phage terminase small subunit
MGFVVSKAKAEDKKVVIKTKRRAKRYKATHVALANKAAQETRLKAEKIVKEGIESGNIKYDNPDGARLVHRYEEFCRTYVKTKNATKAYALCHPDAGQGNCEVGGCKWLKKPKVAQRISELLDIATRPAMVTEEEVINYLANQMRFDRTQLIANMSDSGIEYKPLEDWPKEAKSLVQGFKTSIHGDGVSVPVIDFADGQKAALALKQHFEKIRFFRGGGAQGKGVTPETVMSLAEVNLALAQQMVSMQEFPEDNESESI